jgi:signal transduction histidine kinase
MEQQGSGSGLTVAKGLIELHNGRIQVESQVGQGSTFTVFLPIYNEGKTSNSPVKEPTQIPIKPATILLVEDEWYLLDGLRELLEIFECDYNLRVITASNGVEGLEKLEQIQPDLIITDIMMPKMDGYQFLANVRENPALLQIPVILLTARGERRDILRGRISGAEEYIVKPYDSDELLDLVIKQLDRHFQMQGAIRQNFDELKRGILDLLQPDFRNPLASVSDYSQRLETSLENVQTEEEMRDSLKGIQSASQRITKMVEDFIFLAEIRTGEAVGSFELLSRPINASIILMEACDFVQSEAATHNIAIRRKVDMNLPQALLDYDRLKAGIQRLLHLLIDYCAKNGKGSVLVGSLVKDDFVHLVLGIDDLSFSDEKAEQVNNLFAQEDVNDLELSEHDPDLVIIKGIIVLHSGQIWIDNRPGLRARFVISLPIYQPTLEFDQD